MMQTQDAGGYAEFVASGDLLPGFNYDVRYITCGHVTESFAPVHRIAVNLEQSSRSTQAAGATRRTPAPGETWFAAAQRRFPSERVCGYRMATLKVCKVTTQGLVAGVSSLVGRVFPHDLSVEDALLRGLVGEIDAEMRKEENADSGVLESYARTAILHIIGHYGEAVSESRELSSRGLSAEQLRSLLTYMDEHVRDRVNIGEMARAVGVDLSTLIKRFKAHFGLTPYRYFLNRKAMLSQKLLMNYEGDIARAAHEAGFADQSHFTRVFKQLVGTTPGRFLNQIRSGDSTETERAPVDG